MTKAVCRTDWLSATHFAAVVTGAAKSTGGRHSEMEEGRKDEESPA